mmetsp:Transcript_12576/g.49015  ORF Transcript_12576/g.49015 Transcript_12576/m.49015 type:complete len:246 (+) Transcript_12576:360-1097(+)
MRHHLPGRVHPPTRRAHVQTHRPGVQAQARRGPALRGGGRRRDGVVGRRAHLRRVRRGGHSQRAAHRGPVPGHRKRAREGHGMGRGCSRNPASERRLAIVREGRRAREGGGRGFVAVARGAAAVGRARRAHRGRRARGVGTLAVEAGLAQVERGRGARIGRRTRTFAFKRPGGASRRRVWERDVPKLCARASRLGGRRLGGQHGGLLGGKRVPVARVHGRHRASAEERPVHIAVARGSGGQTRQP